MEKRIVFSIFMAGNFITIFNGLGQKRFQEEVPKVLRVPRVPGVIDSGHFLIIA
jgi:hypothetical protein